MATVLICAVCQSTFTPSNRGQICCGRQCGARYHWRLNRVDRTCQYCDKPFTVRLSFIEKGGGTYCSNDCKALAQMRGERKTCPSCRESFYASAGNMKRGADKFCSMKCARVPIKTLQQRTCQQCGIVFEIQAGRIRRGDGKFCSDPCFRQAYSPGGVAYKTGADHPGWKGGRKNRPYGADDHNWRRAVFTRDDFRCRRCGKRSGDLHAHHIKPWKTHPDLRLDVNNGITLHEECHRLTHREMRRAARVIWQIPMF